MKIKIIRNLAGMGFAYFEGQEIDCSDSLAMTLINRASAIPIQEPVLPMDFPAREILMENELNTVDKIKAFGYDNLNDLNGIGKKTVEYIKAYIKDWA